MMSPLLTKEASDLLHKGIVVNNNGEMQITLIIEPLAQVNIIMIT